MRFAAFIIFLNILSCAVKRDQGPPYAADLASLAYLTDLQESLEFYASCNDIQQDIKQRIEAWQQNQKDRLGYLEQQTQQQSPGASSDSNNVPNSDEGEAVLDNVQEQGVDEADQYKFNGTFVTITNSEKTEIIKLSPLQNIVTIEHLGEKIPLTYVTSSHLIVIVPGNFSTWVRTYRFNGENLPEKEIDRTITGLYHDSRMIGDELVLVLNHKLPFTPPGEEEIIIDYDPHRSHPYDIDSIVNEEPILAEEGKIDNIPCTAYMKSSVSDFDFQTTKIVKMNTQNNEDDSQAIVKLGQTSQIYMTRNHIYLAENSLDFVPWTPPGVASIESSFYDQTVLTKIAYNEDEIPLYPKAFGLIIGFPENQWSFHEANEDVLLLTTTLKNQHFFSALEEIEGRMELTRQIRSFGTGQELSSVRYLADRAFVSTSQSINNPQNPIFTFDIADPRKPFLMGELTIPGVSDYFHPLSDGRLIGIGKGPTNEIQISLFATSDLSHPERLSKVSLGAPDSMALVSVNHHAFWYDTEQESLILPIKDPTLNPGFQGASIISLAGGPLEEIGRLDHSLVESSCPEQIYRVYRAGDKIVSLSNRAVQTHNWGEWDTPVESIGLSCD